MCDYDEDEYYYDSENAEEYECQNVGCVGSGTFWHNEESWFRDKGACAPSNCKPCRNWIEAQKCTGPVIAFCRYCKWCWSIEASYRIIFHKKIGNWDDHWESSEDEQICYLCTENPNRRNRFQAREAERRAREASPAHHIRRQRKEGGIVKIDFYQDPRGKKVQRFDIPSALMFYKGISTHLSKVHKHGANQLEHIMKSKHEWGEKLGTNDPGTIVSLAAQIAKKSDDSVRQFKDASTGKIVKYDIGQKIVIILSKDDRSLTGVRLETAYVYSDKKVKEKVDNTKWIE